jgi:hypothetical protein
MVTFFLFFFAENTEEATKVWLLAVAAVVKLMFSFSPGRVFVCKRERDADFFVLWIKTRTLTHTLFCFEIVSVAKRFLVSPSSRKKKRKRQKNFLLSVARSFFSEKLQNLPFFRAQKQVFLFSRKKVTPPALVVT